MKKLHVVCASFVGLLALLGATSVASAQEVDLCTPQVDVLTEIDVRHEQRCRAERARQQTTTQVARPAVTAPAPRPARTPVVATTAPREERRPSIPPLRVPPRRRPEPQVAPPAARSVPPLRRPQASPTAASATTAALVEVPRVAPRPVPRPFIPPTMSPMAMAPAGDTAGVGRILAQIGRSPNGVPSGDCRWVHNPGDEDSARQGGDGLFENVVVRGTRGTRQRAITFPYAVSFVIDALRVTLVEGRRPRPLMITNRRPQSMLFPGEWACIPIPPVLPGRVRVGVDQPRGVVRYHIWRLFSNGTARQMIDEYTGRGLVGELPFGNEGEYVINASQIGGWGLRAIGQ